MGHRSEYVEPDPALVGALRAALSAAGFTYDAVAELLGPLAHRALGRNETVPGLRRTVGAGPLGTLTRLWLLQAPVDADAAEAALPGLIDPLCALGLMDRSGGEVRALVDVRPYATEALDLWVASDLTPGLDGRSAAVRPDHVLGISSAAISLAQLTVRRPVGRALDLGTGCGVQALHLAGHADQVVATDVNPRALWLTRLNAALNDTPVTVRAGSLFEPVAEERFDLVATNPPFVISPATDEPLVYRDSGLPGDRVVEQIVREVPDHLTEGGIAQVLANWLVMEDITWQERLSGWVRDCDAWVVQREVLDPAAYVELWLKDAGVHPSTGGDLAEYRRRYDSWLGWLEAIGAEGIGFGWINLRRTGAPPPHLRIEEWPYDVEQPIAPAIAEWGAAAHLDGDLGDRRLVARPDLVQDTQGPPGAEDPATVVIRQQRGFRRARQVDTVEAALIGACDGDLTIAQILDALATILDREPTDLRSTYLPVVKDLVREGFLQAERSGR